MAQIKLAAQADPRYFYKDYRIIRDDNSHKWGIKNTKSNSIIVKCEFDYIKWIREYNMIDFCYNDKHALCKIDNIGRINI